jgi:hypothetical protein
MTSNSMRSTLVAGAILGLAGIASATAAPVPATSDATPIVLAQAASPSVSTGMAPMEVRQYPAYQRGVREAAAQGPEALRRYIWRTRMIYNFRYSDFVPMPM